MRDGKERRQYDKGVIQLPIPQWDPKIALRLMRKQALGATEQPGLPSMGSGQKYFTGM